MLKTALIVASALLLLSIAPQGRAQKLGERCGARNENATGCDAGL